MTKLGLVYDNENFSDTEINNSIEQLLDNNELCAMSTINGPISHIFTSYFVYSKSLNFYFLSQPTDQHVLNLKDNPSIAISVWNQTVKWGDNLQGIQLFGTCKQLIPGLEMIEGMSLFLQRFHDFSGIIKEPGIFADGISSKLFSIRIASLKLLDEPQFGRRNYLKLEVK